MYEITADHALDQSPCGLRRGWRADIRETGGNAMQQCCLPIAKLEHIGTMSETSLQEKLVSLVAESAATMQALGAARSLGLGSWCIGAEAVRNLVWDHLHGFEVATRPEDVDLVFYEAADLSQGLERNLESKLALAAPEFKWEVVNQAAFIDGSALNPEKGLSHSGHWLKASRRGQRSPNA